MRGLADVNSVEELGMKIAEMMGMGDLPDHHGETPEWVHRIEDELRQLGERWPNPEDAPPAEVYDFIMGALAAAGVPPDVHEKIMEKLGYAESSMDMAMAVYGVVEQYYDHGSSTGGEPTRPEWAERLMGVLMEIG